MSCYLSATLIGQNAFIFAVAVNFGSIIGMFVLSQRDIRKQIVLSRLVTKLENAMSLPHDDRLDPVSRHVHVHAFIE